MKSLLLKLLLLRRIYKQLIIMIADSFLLIFALLLSFSLRLDYFFIPNGSLSIFIFLSPVLGVLIFYNFKLYNSVTRYIGFNALLSIFQAVSLYAAAWGLIGYMSAIEGIFSVSQNIPRSVIFLNWMISIILIGGIRLAASWFFKHNHLEANTKKTNVIIFGSGPAGIQFSNALALVKDYKHIAFINDGDLEDGSYVNGIPVFPLSKIEYVIHKFNVTEVLLALSAVSRKKRSDLIELISPLNVHVRTIPSFADLADGKIKINELREINIGDLLGRDSVKPNEKLMKIKIKDKVVMVTGAGGSIGSELCRQIVYLNPRQLILYESNEASLYHIEQELINFGISNVEVFPVLGSVLDSVRLNSILDYYKVRTIYHAAAYKHVPLVEYNQSQGVLNNVIGTLTTAEAAINSKVETFVLISTDKAVRPTSTMGATKRISELVLQALAKLDHDTCLTMVRFGNVLDSSGSVIPLFKKQIQNGGPLTVTHAEVVRYFMSIPEAVELVIQAGAMGTGGDVFVLDMGNPVKIYDLAVRMIQLSGLQLKNDQYPEGDIEIKYIGLRPGEKLYEELLVGDRTSKTENKVIMRAEEKMIDWKKLKPLLQELKNASFSTNQEKLRDIITEIVPEFKPQSSIVDLIHK
jgi:FlaA1/EpsC-like NDP-sugar epimerase